MLYSFLVAMFVFWAIPASAQTVCIFDGSTPINLPPGGYCINSPPVAEPPPAPGNPPPSGSPPPMMRCIYDDNGIPMNLAPGASCINSPPG